MRPFPTLLRSFLTKLRRLAPFSDFVALFSDDPAPSGGDEK
jgi:hypothetical protein